MDLFSVMDMISTLPISVTQMQTAMQISHMLITSRMNQSMLETSKPIVYSVVQKVEEISG